MIQSCLANTLVQGKSQHSPSHNRTALALLTHAVFPNVPPPSTALNHGGKPSLPALLHLLRLSADHGIISLSRLLHAYLTKHAFLSHTPLYNSLLRFYKKTDSLDDAHKLFYEIPDPDIISWNSLFSGYVQSGRCQEGLGFFLQLHRSHVLPNAFSFTLALTACARLRLLRLGGCVHSKVVKFGIEKGNVVANCLIDMYGKCGSLEDAVSVFRDMEERDTVSWNAIVASCARNGELELGLFFFRQMPKPDTVTYNELIDALVKYGELKGAIQILSTMPNPNTSSWNSILTGYVNRNESSEALDFFATMLSAGVEVDEYTISVVLAAIAALSVVSWGSLIHTCALKRGLDSLVVVASALVDMYSKCGQLKSAELMFRTMPRKNLIAWNTMISAYARNGNSSEAIELFHRMKEEKFLKPDRVTFLNLLAACSHCEVAIEDMVKYFESMINDYGIKPSVEHCCSMIRAMGQRGEVGRAKQIIQEFGFGHDSVAWRALLSACGACRDLKAAKIVAAKIIETGEADEDEYVYVVMSNLNAYYGKWREVSVIRKMMREKGVKKEPGSSWIQEDHVHTHS